MYITTEEYKDFTGKEVPENFKHLENLAGTELDSVTRFYFKFNDLGDDFLSQQFKKALIIQVDFLNDNGITTVEELNNRPTSVRLGDMTVSYGRQGSSNENAQRVTALSNDALNALRGTGLLYRGATR